MEENDNGEDKQFEPTAMKLDQARRDGLAPRSADLGATMALILSLGAISAVLPMMLKRIESMMASMLSNISADMNVIDAGTSDIMWLAGGAIVIGIATVAGGWSAAAIMGNIRPNSRRLSFDWRKISMSAGLGRMLQRPAGVRALLAVVKVAIVGGVLTHSLWNNGVEMMGLWTMEPSVMARRTLAMIGSASWKLAGAMVLVAVIDWAYQRWEFYQSLKMTRRELIEESKKTQVDVTIRRRRMKRVT